MNNAKLGIELISSLQIRSVLMSIQFIRLLKVINIQVPSVTLVCEESEVANSFAFKLIL